MGWFLCNGNTDLKWQRLSKDYQSLDTLIVSSSKGKVKLQPGR